MKTGYFYMLVGVVFATAFACFLVIIPRSGSELSEAEIDHRTQVNRNARAGVQAEKDQSLPGYKSQKCQNMLKERDRLNALADVMWDTGGPIPDGVTPEILMNHQNALSAHCNEGRAMPAMDEDEMRRSIVAPIPANPQNFREIKSPSAPRK